MGINRASEARIDVGSKFGDPIPQIFKTIAIGCVEDWHQDSSVPGGIEPGDTVIEQCGVADCTRTKEYQLDADLEMQIVCNGLCKRTN